MLRRSKLLVLAALLGSSWACNTRYSASAFHLPADGDVERGKAAFLALGCNSCHQVSGTDLPQPAVQPPVPVVLGGDVNERYSDAFLVTEVIDPSRRLAPYPREQIAVDGRSRMPHYADRMSVRQLTDIVAFLQAQYRVRPRLPQYVYY
ncbi:MAG: cytochrome c [Acidobacteriia bacterium]|nr:cytochrome c [Terriglobia bacterium]